MVVGMIEDCEGTRSVGVFNTVEEYEAFVDKMVELGDDRDDYWYEGAR